MVLVMQSEKSGVKIDPTLVIQGLTKHLLYVLVFITNNKKVTIFYYFLLFIYVRTFYY